MLKKILSAAAVLSAVTLLSSPAQALLVDVAYNGNYDETSAPSGDYDAIGGLSDVGVFTLLSSPAGYANTFTGSAQTPSDSSDVFVIHVADGDTLTSANIVFGTNLSAFNPLGIGSSLTRWVLEKNSGTDPAIFDVGVAPDNPQFGPITYTPSFAALGGGFYNVLLGNGVFAAHNGAIGYKMTFNVEAAISAVPLPASLPLYGAGLLGLAFLARKRRKNAS
ncbi:MAG: VPLPA-CTERM sorting domain-containing protein [Sneathiella sp.]